MMTAWSYVIDSMPLQYHEIVDFVLDQGSKVSPRGDPTIEVEDVTIAVRRPWYALPTGTGRQLNLAIGAVEALQLIAGTARPQLLKQVSPNFERLFEGERMYGMYGDRIGNQLNHVVHKLLHDPDTRQAVITLWRPDLDNDPGHKDYPCTLGMQFRIRNGRLCMSTVMRSNDVILGLAYDVFQFTQLQLTIANLIDVDCGQYNHHVFSLHLYERDLRLAQSLHRGTEQNALVGVSGVDVWDVRERARKLLDDVPLEQPTYTEMWYREQLDKATARARDRE